MCVYMSAANRHIRSQWMTTELKRVTSFGRWRTKLTTHLSFRVVAAGHRLFYLIFPFNNTRGTETQQLFKGQYPSSFTTPYSSDPTPAPSAATNSPPSWRSATPPAPCTTISPADSRVAYAILFMIFGRTASPRLMSRYVPHSIDSSHLENFLMITAPAK